MEGSGTALAGSGRQDVLQGLNFALHDTFGLLNGLAGLCMGIAKALVGGLVCGLQLACFHQQPDQLHVGHCQGFPVQAFCGLAQAADQRGQFLL